MTDIHTHILPAVDDGAQSAEQAFKMLEAACKSGTTELVLTPHFCPPEYRNGAEKLAGKFNEFINEAQKRIPVKLYTGMEVMATENISEHLKNGSVLTINGSRFLLVEFAFNESPARAQQYLNAVLSAGYIPVIAHPERYFFIQDCPPILYDWVQNGALTQINSGSITGEFGTGCARTAKIILQCGLAHTAASDAHSERGRNASLSEAYAAVANGISEGCADILFNFNPHEILADGTPFVPKAVMPPMC